jgi:hypothetical protein
MFDFIDRKANSGSTWYLGIGPYYWSLSIRKLLTRISLNVIVLTEIKEST